MTLERLVQLPAMGYSNKDSDRVPDDELKYWLALTQDSNLLGSRKLALLLDRFRSMEVAWHASDDELRGVSADLFTPIVLKKLAAFRKTCDPDEILARLRKTDVDALTFIDPAYPFKLRHAHEPPMVIYFRGTIPPPQRLNYVCAIVGTRKATQYGLKCAREISQQLVQSGCIIASGMASGIDAAAHWGAIEGGGVTIAVLAGGVDVIYPPPNKKLYDAILSNNGCVVSEYFPGTQPDKWMFPQRNRIVAGMSQAITIVEAPESSGALITAHMAFDSGGEVFVVPGRIDTPTFKGSNALVVNRKAHLITSAEDLLKEMNWVKVESPHLVPTVVELFGREKEIYDLLVEVPTHFDVLCERTGMPAGEMSATLTMLELAGIVVRHPGDWYSKVTKDNPAPSLPM